jgi:hypothetical protein
MKRAAILVLAIATLVLLGSPSAPLLADSNNSPTKSSAGPSVVAPPGGSIERGASEGSGTGGGGGGTDQGDADGLSGLKVQPSGRSLGTLSGPERVAFTVEMWWRFMVWIR